MGMPEMRETREMRELMAVINEEGEKMIRCGMNV